MPPLIGGGRACLITGGPGSGKTTIVRQAASAAGVRAGGFYTEEVRSGGVRQGFRIVTLDGKTLPHRRRRDATVVKLFTDDDRHIVELFAASG